LGVESKVFSVESLEVLCKFNWPGNVRQLENTCRWVTVMSSSKEILVQDLPPELLQLTVPKNISRQEISIQDGNQMQKNIDWQYLLEQWAKEALLAGKVGILTEAVADVERILLNCALNFTRGHKQDAAHLLGWGRNTLTRKLKELSDDK